MSNLEKTDIRLGYVPLLDCVAILWAKHQGYFAELGLDVTLIKEASWASLRDRLAFGFLDAAHCLSAMLPAATIGIDQIGIPFQTSQVLSLNRAFISLSQKLCYDWNISKQDSPQQSAEKIVQAMQHSSIHLAHVFKHSIHHYCLKEWIALADKHIALTSKLLTCPPPYMVETIAKKTIDGFCVGEPWNIQAEIQGHSYVIAQSKDIIPTIPDKVLAITQDWAVQHPNTLTAITTAIEKAQQDLKTMHDFSEVWQLLKDYQIIRFECSEDIHVDAYHKINLIINGLGNIAKPQFSDFEWIIQTMNRWDDLELDVDTIKNIASQCIYQS